MKVTCIFAKWMKTDDGWKKTELGAIRFHHYTKMNILARAFRMASVKQQEANEVEVLYG